MSQNDSQNTNNNNKKKKTQDIEVSSASTNITEKPSSKSLPGEAITAEPNMITVPRDQYQTLVQLNMGAYENTLNVLDDLDKIIGSLINMQAFAMNIKETIKRRQFGTTNNNNNSQQGQPTEKPNA